MINMNLKLIIRYEHLNPNDPAILEVTNTVNVAWMNRHLSSVSWHTYDHLRTYFQTVSLPLFYAEKVLDHDHNGLISVSEAIKNPVFNTMVGNITLLLETTNATTTKHQLNPNYNTIKMLMKHQ